MTPKWKKAGPNGEIETTVKDQRYKIEKSLDHNDRHKGEFKIMVWDKRRKDWEWDNTVKGKGYAKELVMDKLNEDAMTTADAGIPQDTKNMGPRKLPTHILRRKLGVPISVTDRRRKKDKSPVLLKQFKRFVEENG
jgi:hypothetical protein